MQNVKLTAKNKAYASEANLTKEEALSAFKSQQDIQLDMIQMQANLTANLPKEPMEAQRELEMRAMEMHATAEDRLYEASGVTSIEIAKAISELKLDQDQDLLAMHQAF